MSPDDIVDQLLLESTPNKVGNPGNNSPNKLLYSLRESFPTKSPTPTAAPQPTASPTQSPTKAPIVLPPNGIDQNIPDREIEDAGWKRCFMNLYSQSYSIETIKRD